MKCYCGQEVDTPHKDCQLLHGIVEPEVFILVDGRVDKIIFTGTHQECSSYILKNYPDRTKNLWFAKKVSF